MTDLDLIEAAGRAAGYAVRRCRVGEVDVIHALTARRVWVRFDPLSDSTEAFRLLANCRMALSVGESNVVATVFPGGGALTILEPVKGDPAAVARRAIVRAAEALYNFRSAGELE